MLARQSVQDIPGHAGGARDLVYPTQERTAFPVEGRVPPVSDQSVRQDRTSIPARV